MDKRHVVNGENSDNGLLHLATVKAEAINAIDDHEEAKAFQKVIDAFRYYKHYSFQQLRSRLLALSKLSQRHLSFIPNYRPHLKELHKCITRNEDLINMMLSGVDNMFENASYSGDETMQAAANGFDDDDNDISIKEIKKSKLHVTPVPNFYMEKVVSTLKQFVRDWSELGYKEREACYSAVIKEIAVLFPTKRSERRVLVPGAGLGRLAYEFARLGFQSQGNEFSFFMLIASNFILNRCKGKHLYSVYPFVHQMCNNMSNNDQSLEVRFPDVDPSALPDGASFSMAAGDFLEVYRDQRNSFDAVATVFFVDTAHNIIEYFETIWDILKPGGYWVNLGPLLYHFADVPGELSIELSYEDVKSVIERLGFYIIKEETHVKCPYAQNPSSMLHYIYDCVYLVCQKPDCNDVA